MVSVEGYDNVTHNDCMSDNNAYTATDIVPNVCFGFQDLAAASNLQCLLSESGPVSELGDNINITFNTKNNYSTQFSHLQHHWTCFKI